MIIKTIKSNIKINHNISGLPILIESELEASIKTSENLEECQTELCMKNLKGLIEIIDNVQTNAYKDETES